MRFIDEFHCGHLKGQIGKNLNLSIPYFGSINTKIKPNPKTDPIEEVMAATHLEASQPNLDEEAKDYIKELETELDEPLELDESEPPPKPSIELKGISPALCTYRIPIEPNATPSREPQRRLNNAMREVVKKEVLKLLHAGIIYPIPNSEWVSPVQVVPKKGGMMVVKNDNNEHPTTNHHKMEDVHRLPKTQQGYKERSLPVTLHR